MAVFNTGSIYLFPSIQFQGPPLAFVGRDVGAVLRVQGSWNSLQMDSPAGGPYYVVTIFSNVNFTGSSQSYSSTANVSAFPFTALSAILSVIPAIGIALPPAGGPAGVPPIVPSECSPSRFDVVTTSNSWIWAVVIILVVLLVAFLIARRR